MKRIVFFLGILFVIIDSKFVVHANNDVLNHSDVNAVSNNVVMRYEPSYDSYDMIVDDEYKIIIYFDSEFEIAVHFDVLDETKKIINWFETLSNCSLKRAKTGSDGYLQIYLEYDSVFAGGFDGLAVARNNWFGSIQYYGYILLNYDSMIYDNDYDDDDGIIESYKNTLAHEIMHVIMYQYNLILYDSSVADDYYIFDWFHEGLSTAVGLKYFIDEYGNEIEDVNEDILVTTRTRMFKYLTNTSLSLYEQRLINLDSAYVDNRRGYETFMFFYNILEKYGMRIYQDILETYFDMFVSYNERGELMNIFNNVLMEYESSISEEYIEFSGKNSFPRLSYSNYLGSYSSQFSTLFDDAIFLNGKYDVIQTIKPLSSHYYQLEYDGFDDFFKISISLSNYEKFDLQLVTKTTSNIVQYYPITLNSNNESIVVNENYLTNVDEIVLVIVQKEYYSSNESYNLTIEKKDYTRSTLNSSIEISPTLYENYESLYVSYTCFQTGYYNISATYDIGIGEEDDIIMLIYDNNLTLIKSNTFSEDSFFIFLEKGNRYYVAISNVSFCRNVTLSIYSVQYLIDNRMVLESDLAETCEENMICSEENEYFYCYKAYHLGAFNIQMNFDVVNDNVFNVVILRKHADNIVVFGEYEVSNSILLSCDVILYEGSDLYIIVTGLNNYYASCNLSINRTIDTAINLWCDPNENVTVGSEVTMNDGIFQGTTITQGYTRCVYINDDLMSKSRLDYSWYSSNEETAKVSDFGTVTATSNLQNIVTIYAVYKANPSKVGVITFTILPDLSTDEIEVSLTTDCRTGGTISGTEVTDMGGAVGDNELHIGYTRLICFSGDSPTTSIQDFIWHSSNEDVVTVSEFGTILAIGEGEAYIYGTYKYNSNFVAELYVYVN